MSVPDDVVSENAPVATGSPDDPTPVGEDPKRPAKAFFASLEGILAGVAGVLTAMVAIAGLFIAKDGSVPFTGWPSDGTPAASSESEPGGSSGSSLTASRSNGAPTTHSRGGTRDPGSSSSIPLPSDRAQGTHTAQNPGGTNTARKRGGTDTARKRGATNTAPKPGDTNTARKPDTGPAGAPAEPSPAPSTPAPNPADGTGAPSSSSLSPPPSNAPSAATQKVETRDRFSDDERLSAARDDFLVSADGRYRLVMQRDSNLVLYGPSGRNLWESDTKGLDADHARMQSDGNLVIYDRRNAAIWESHTSGHRNAFLIIQNDGNVVIYADGGWIWASGTSGHT